MADIGGSRAPDQLHAADVALVERYDCVLLDLDGVIYRGGAVIDGAVDALRGIREAGSHPAFVTNNAARTPEVVAAQLVGLGIEASASDVVTSAQAAAHEVAQLVPAGSPVLCVGAEGLRQALVERGLRPLADTRDEPAAAVVQGFDPELTWQRLAQAAYAVATGVPWVATNLDATVPTAAGIAPGNGTLVSAVATAAGRRPDVVAGKPARPLFDETLRRVGGSRPLLVGDRLDTDIAGARAVGADSLLVLSGVATLAQACCCPPSERPSFVGWNVSAVLRPHPLPRPDAAGWSFDEWRVEVVDAPEPDGVRAARVQVTGSGDPDAGLRTVVAAAWAWHDTHPGAAADALDLGDAGERLGGAAH